MRGLLSPLLLTFFLYDLSAVQGCWSAHLSQICPPYSYIIVDIELFRDEANEPAQREGPEELSHKGHIGLLDKASVSNTQSAPSPSMESHCVIHFLVESITYVLH